MRDLNYLHLFHFWIVAREGSVAGASRHLKLAQPTISGQIHELERSLGHSLFARVGRGLELTDTGHVAYQFAEKIFSLGHEMLEALDGQPARSALRLRIGIMPAIPPMLTRRILAPIQGLQSGVNIIAREHTPDHFLAELLAGELDLVLCDASSAVAGMKAHKHLLGECGTSFLVSAKHAPELRRHFPSCLHGTRMLLPSGPSALRREIERWLDSQRLRPEIVGEFDRASLMEAYAEGTARIFPSPTVIERDLRQRYAAGVVGRVPEIVHRFYAISAERTVRHPAVAGIIESAKKLFR